MNWVFSKNFVGHKGVGKYVQSDESKNKNKPRILFCQGYLKSIWRRNKDFFIEKQKLRVLKYYSGFRQKSSRHFSKEKKKTITNIKSHFIFGKTYSKVSRFTTYKAIWKTKREK